MPGTSGIIRGGPVRMAEIRGFWAHFRVARAVGAVSKVRADLDDG